MQPLLTIETIRENPWSVLTHELPSAPDQVLLRLACLAADYCCVSEHLLTEAAHEGDYIPSWWRPDECLPDVHEESEDHWLEALEKLEFLKALFAKLYGEAAET